MSDTIENEKFVELNYKVIDNKTGDVLVTIDYPLGYVHGVNDVLSEQVTNELVGKKSVMSSRCRLTRHSYMASEMNRSCSPIISKMSLRNITKLV